MLKCRGCFEDLDTTFLDLGHSPIANNLLTLDKINQPEDVFPLHARVCMKCSLVQLPEVSPKESIFDSNYVYHSSYSKTWLEHAEKYVMHMKSVLNLSSDDLVIEVASNDGYLLQFFNNLGIKVMGIEPSEGVANIAMSKDIPTLVDFFGQEVAKQLSSLKKPKLMLGNNVLAHVPDLHDFIEGFATLIDDEGIITFEFPHLVNLIQLNQFDTIYHEHYSYLNISSISPIFEEYNLRIFDVEKLSTHGGSLRIYVAKQESSWLETDSVRKIKSLEERSDPRSPAVRERLQQHILNVKNDLISELIRCKQNGLKVAAYGAAAKGNTLLNFTGANSNHISYVVDANPYKVGKYLPGSKIPIFGIENFSIDIPDVLLVLPWNLSKEIKAQLSHLTQFGMKFLRAIPEVEYF